MAGKAAIGHARSRRAAALLVQRRTCGGKNGRIKGQAEIVVGAHKDGRTVADHRLCRRQDAVHHDPGWIGLFGAQGIAQIRQFGKTV